MSNETILLQHLFGQSNIDQVTVEQVANLVKKYPYFAHARWFMALKSAPENLSSDAAAEAAMYTSLPLRLIQFLQNPSRNDNEENVPAITTDPPEDNHDTNIAGTETIIKNPDAPLANKEGKNAVNGVATAPNTYPAPPLIQPLFTRDYFAYTGHKLPDHIENDKRPTMDQVLSFTGWLRTLKRNQGTTDPDLKEDAASMAARDENEGANIKESAEQSIKIVEDVLTEAMAEVRISNGQTDKAIDIYEKLSLSNPEKSAYFAKKIADLKNS